MATYGYKSTTIHSVARPCICKLCNKLFCSIGRLQYHTRKHHKKKSFICKENDCDASFVYAGPYYRHRTLHQSDIYDCKICGQRCDNYAQLNIHKWRYHKLMGREDKRIVCPVVSQSEASSGSLKLKIRIGQFCSVSKTIEKDVLQNAKFEQTSTTRSPKEPKAKKAKRERSREKRRMRDKSEKKKRKKSRRSSSDSRTHKRRRRRHSGSRGPVYRDSGNDTTDPEEPSPLRITIRSSDLDPVADKHQPPVTSASPCPLSAQGQARQRRRSSRQREKPVEPAGPSPQQVSPRRVKVAVTRKVTLTSEMKPQGDDPLSRMMAVGWAAPRPTFVSRPPPRMAGERKRGRPSKRPVVTETAAAPGPSLTPAKESLPPTPPSSDEGKGSPRGSEVPKLSPMTLVNPLTPSDSSQFDGLSSAGGSPGVPERVFADSLLVHKVHSPQQRVSLEKKSPVCGSKRSPQKVMSPSSAKTKSISQIIDRIKRKIHQDVETRHQHVTLQEDSDEPPVLTPSGGREASSPWRSASPPALFPEGPAPTAATEENNAQQQHCPELQSEVYPATTEYIDFDDFVKLKQQEFEDHKVDSVPDTTLLTGIADVAVDGNKDQADSSFEGLVSEPDDCESDPEAGDLEDMDDVLTSTRSDVKSIASVPPFDSFNSEFQKFLQTTAETREKSCTSSPGSDTRSVDDPTLCDVTTNQVALEDSGGHQQTQPEVPVPDVPVSQELSSPASEDSPKARRITVLNPLTGHLECRLQERSPKKKSRTMSWEQNAGPREVFDFEGDEDSPPMGKITHVTSQPRTQSVLCEEDIREAIAQRSVQSKSKKGKNKRPSFIDAFNNAKKRPRISGEKRRSQSSGITSPQGNHIEGTSVAVNSDQKLPAAAKLDMSSDDNTDLAAAYLDDSNTKDTDGVTSPPAKQQPVHSAPDAGSARKLAPLTVIVDDHSPTPHCPREAPPVSLGFTPVTDASVKHLFPESRDNGLLTLATRMRSDSVTSEERRYGFRQRGQAPSRCSCCSDAGHHYQRHARKKPRDPTQRCDWQGARDFMRQQRKVIALRRRLVGLYRALLPEATFLRGLSSESPMVEVYAAAMLDIMADQTPEVTFMGPESKDTTDNSKQVRDRHFMDITDELSEAEPSFLEVKVMGCNNPRKCLMRMRRTSMRLLRVLLPTLTLPEEFVDNSEHVELLLDKVVKMNTPR